MNHQRLMQVIGETDHRPTSQKDVLVQKVSLWTAQSFIPYSATKVFIGNFTAGIEIQVFVWERVMAQREEQWS